MAALPPKELLKFHPLYPNLPIAGNLAVALANSGASAGVTVQISLGIPEPVYNRRHAIDGVLYFTIKTHKLYYDKSCNKCYKNYDVDPEGRHVLVTALSFMVKKFRWGNDTCDILDIASDKFDPRGRKIHKFLLEHDGEFDLLFLSDGVSTYITLNSRSAQDNTMIYDCIISSLSSDVLVKISNRPKDYHWGEWESGVLLIKVVLDKSGLQINATVMKEKAILANLHELMIWLVHNVSKFNAHVL